jgi:UDP-2-acetamido-3-amino-2,3-dideoxy-glucuronate N-acetyltransferase
VTLSQLRAQTSPTQATVSSPINPTPEIAPAHVRIAVIGGGYWGKNLVRNFAEMGNLGAIVENNPKTAADLVAKHGSQSVELNTTLADPNVHGVAIALPAEMHFDAAKKALLAGKHVFVEKPLALEVKEAEELHALALKLNLRLMVGHLLQYHPAYIKLKQVVSEGLIGKVQYIYSNRLAMGKLRQEEDVLWALGPHDLSMVLGLTGADPVDVTAFGANTLNAHIADHAHVQMTFANGVRGHVFVSWLHPIKEQRFVVVGDKGMIVFEDSQTEQAKKLMHYANTVSWVNGAPLEVKGDATSISYELSEPLRNECTHFVNAIASGETPRTDGVEGLRVLNVLARASVAMKAGQKNAAPAPSAKASSRVVGEHIGAKIHESAYVDAGVNLGKGTDIWHFSHILGDVTIGENCKIGQNVVIGPKVTIGNGVKVQNNVSIYEGVILEDGVFCGPSCVFTNVNNPRAEIVRKAEYRQTLVKKGATIGANATIVCGHTLGQYCFIAAGAVVAKDVPDFALMAGVPAKRIGWVSHFNSRLVASEKAGELVCPDTGRRYREVSKDQLEEIL